MVGGLHGLPAGAHADGHFLTLLAKCCESPWTTKTLSHTAKLDTRFSEIEQAVASTVTQPSPCPSTLSHCSTLSTLSLTEPVLPVQVVLDTSRQGATLDRSDREQARALFERVRRFRAHCESSDVIYKVKPKIY
uniref:LRRC8 pannexin-like TM region domain-containing protein n=1 Tax=Sinocyclocheilus anshuiensis TaxID=1608454 RepID=A0A671RMK3_9TELE